MESKRISQGVVAVNEPASGQGKRQKISVCVATYQGARYVGPQLRSILEQLSATDEVIVVDDHSTDQTREVILDLRDPRVRLIENANNRGVAASFEEALRQASGELVFLSDQDDVWVAHKVAKVLAVFDEEPRVTLVVTDAELIDEHGMPLAMSYYATRGGFRSGLLSNLIRCNYLGCTMAFRSYLIPKVIPFPLDTDVLHDIWIGAVNRITRGTTRYLSEPLVLYRRHPAAVTKKELSLAHKVVVRLHLLRAVANYCTRNLLGEWLGSGHGV